MNTKSFLAQCCNIVVEVSSNESIDYLLHCPKCRQSDNVMELFYNFEEKIIKNEKQRKQ